MVGVDVVVDAVVAELGVVLVAVDVVVLVSEVFEWPL